jgi:predicted metal-dependent hydrolase
MAFYRRDFHPWQHDNRELIGSWSESSNQSPG